MLIHALIIWIHFSMFYACIAPNTWLVACCVIGDGYAAGDNVAHAGAAYHRGVEVAAAGLEEAR